MGQYYKGRKIGTCERMYYMRLEEAEKLARLGAADDDGIKFKEYLTDNITAFRFPFPDEDAGLPDMIKHDKGFNLPAGGAEVHHETICVSNDLQHSSGGNVNIFLPCPYSDEFKAAGIKTSTGGAGEQLLTVLYEGMRDGKKKTIFACARCGAQQRFSDEDVAKIKTRALEYFEPYNTEGKNKGFDGDQQRYDYAKKIIDRLN